MIEEKSKRIDELLHSLNETRESELRLESSYKKELLAQEKLAAIYKRKYFIDLSQPFSFLTDGCEINLLYTNI